MGDALAIAALKRRGFTAEDFALSHPGGTLGKRLLILVSHLMHTGNAIPCVSTQTLLPAAITEMTEKGFGITAVVDQQGLFCGVFSDGDIRRTIKKIANINAIPIVECMSTHPKTVGEHQLAAEALELMEKHKITALFVIDTQAKPIGIIHLHDLLRAEIT
jgi:arabinose-5-phosphate isomerase